MPREGKGSALGRCAAAIIAVSCDPCKTANPSVPHLPSWITFPASASPVKLGWVDPSKQLLLFPNKYLSEVN